MIPLSKCHGYRLAADDTANRTVVCLAWKRSLYTSCAL